MRGKFLVIEGIDGCGKSTMVKRLACLFDNPLVVHDPGSTELGKMIRNILLHKTDIKLDGLAALYLFNAARRQMLVELIFPALESGRTVISDRYALSTVCYQGCGEQLSRKHISHLLLGFNDEFAPDLTVVLDVDVEEAARRMDGKDKDKYESRGKEFMNRVRDGYIKASGYNGVEFILTSGRTIDDVFSDVVRIITKRGFPCRSTSI